MPNLKDVAAKALNAFHRTVYSATGGRVFGNLYGMPVVMLHTTGRRTGQERTTMLTSPLQEGDTVVLVASYGGDPRHPNWLLNLRDAPDVEATIDGRRRPMRARIASASEKERLWPLVTEKYKRYGGYQERTDRDIPLVLLEPR